MVIIKVPYALSYKDEARIYKKLVYGAPAFRNTHLDPHVLHLAAVFAILTRHQKPEREGLDLPKRCAYSPESRRRVLRDGGRAAASGGSG